MPEISKPVAFMVVLLAVTLAVLVAATLLGGPEARERWKRAPIVALGILAFQFLAPLSDWVLAPAWTVKTGMVLGTFLLVGPVYNLGWLRRLLLGGLLGALAVWLYVQLELHQSADLPPLP